MNEEQIRALIRQEVASLSPQQAFNLDHTPYHIHNGIDVPQILASNINQDIETVFFTRIIIPFSQVLTLHTTPFTLIPAPGYNILTIIRGIAAHLQYGGTAYTGANNLEFRYTDGSGTKVTTDMSSTFLDSSASAFDYAPSVSTEFTPVANAPVVVAVPTANPAAGNSPIIFDISYTTVSFVS